MASAGLKFGLIAAAAASGLAAGAVEILCFRQIGPFSPDSCIAVSMILLIAWLALSVVSFRFAGWKALWVLAPAPLALIGPALFMALLVGCAVDVTMCP